MRRRLFIINNNNKVQNDYFTIMSLEDGNQLSFTNDIEYLSENKWINLPAKNKLTINNNQEIKFKSSLKPESYYGIGTFSSTGNFNVSGNIMSLLYGDDFIDNTDLTGKNYAFYNLFGDNSNIIDASKLHLPAVILSKYCYCSMFYNCNLLTTAPELPATTLADYCYDSMFYNCKSLKNTPELPATTLASNCYYNMFYGCTGLTTSMKILPATVLTERCYQAMFYGCKSLTIAPELHSETLTNYCYYQMFYNCSKLNNIVMLATDISATNCLSNWVSGVAKNGAFTKNINMSSLPISKNGIPSGWEIKDNVTFNECTNLTITADDVIGNVNTTTIYYTAIVNGIDNNGNKITNIVLTGITTSDEFDFNLSETDDIERVITFEFMGVTATTIIIQSTYIKPKYTINLNNQWELSSTISNPDSSLYDGVYQSFSNKGVSSDCALMYIDIVGYTSFNFYVRSYAESSYDYVVVSNLDCTLNNNITSGTNVKLTTSGKQNSGTDINSYQLVEFTGVDGGEHRITVMYRKDVSGNNSDDRGYVLIPKNQ